MEDKEILVNFLIYAVLQQYQISCNSCGFFSGKFKSPSFKDSKKGIFSLWVAVSMGARFLEGNRGVLIYI